VRCPSWKWLWAVERRVALLSVFIGARILLYISLHNNIPQNLTTVLKFLLSLQRKVLTFSKTQTANANIKCSLIMCGKYHQFVFSNFSFFYFVRKFRVTSLKRILIPTLTSKIEYYSFKMEVQSKPGNLLNIPKIFLLFT
jgi:hypothetical protein